MRMRDESSGLYYEVRDGSAAVVDADKKLAEIVIPGTLGDSPVREIGKKSFLGCKLLRAVEVPSGVRAVGDWAFAGCDGLLKVSFPREEIAFGKGVFERDNALNEIEVRGRSEGSAYLLAKAVTLMEAEYMLDTTGCGSREWLLNWDRKLENMLSRRDDEGYHLYVLCGEEDLHLDYDEFLEYTRRKKASLCLLRLLWDEGLAEDFRSELVAYVCSHTIGCESAAAWDYVVRERGDDVEYFRLLSDLGCVDRKNLETALFGLGERYPQAKAYLINRFSGSDGGDFVDDLML